MMTNRIDLRASVILEIYDAVRELLKVKYAHALRQLRAQVLVPHQQISDPPKFMKKGQGDLFACRCGVEERCVTQLLLSLRVNPVIHDRRA